MADKKFPTEYPQKATPSSSDLIPLSDESAGHAFKYATLDSLPVPSSVTSLIS